jgi:hypothetical protein
MYNSLTLVDTEHGGAGHEDCNPCSLTESPVGGYHQKPGSGLLGFQTLQARLIKEESRHLPRHEVQQD